MQVMNEEIFKKFAAAINQHDVEGLYNLMADSHTFIDSHGNKMTGRDKMKHGWAGYFKMFPDYFIEVTDVLLNNNIVAAFGFAGGTFMGLTTPGNENYFYIPAAWKAIIKNDKIELWQVYADTKIPFEIIVRNSK
jgi:hypothetical protein